jgi:hypothetical protein
VIIGFKIFVTTKNQNLLDFTSSVRATGVREALHEWIQVHLQRLHYAGIKKLINRVTTAKNTLILLNTWIKTG